ncbi:MAG: glycine zipper 2TM domain-containing protein [Thiofilum sp.]|uniref:glycine zipper 2TM domain-containing protein n=1 Tax=Thiofilum sp. TaxID=2212733 RepID=UPI0025E3BBB6|nr:glycine zipper 2TM domain-containing protein [Thiofilum sp.]MBK8453177.1 glycine zipper 2TM domain-containing protein [Thiofilum sp.]
MKLSIRILTALGLTATVLVGCGGGAMIPPPSNAQTGAITGSVIGGVIGHQFGKGDGQKAATILGTIIGGYIGGNIGAQMDQQDQANVANSIATGRPATWQNPNTGYTYTAKPGPVYQTTYQNQSTVCRPATIQAVINGRMENVTMKACRAPNGQWQAAD